MKTPAVCVDIVIRVKDALGKEKIVLIKRRNPPYGWAIPGGFVDYGERVEDAARREAFEETTLAVRLERLLGVYSNPQRDPRGHTVSIVYLASATGVPKANDDAKEAGLFDQECLPEELAFDHGQILADYFRGEVA